MIIELICRIAKFTIKNGLVEVFCKLQLGSETDSESLICFVGNTYRNYKHDKTSAVSIG